MSFCSTSFILCIAVFSRIVSMEKDMLVAFFTCCFRIPYRTKREKPKIISKENYIRLGEMLCET